MHCIPMKNSIVMCLSFSGKIPWRLTDIFPHNFHKHLVAIKTLLCYIDVMEWNKHLLSKYVLQSSKKNLQQNSWKFILHVFYLKTNILPPNHVFLCTSKKFGQRIVCETQVAKDSHRNSREALCVACAKTWCGFLCPLLCSKRKPCSEIAPTHRSAEKNYYAKGKKRTIGLIVTPHYVTVFRTKKFEIGCKFGLSYILRMHGDKRIIFSWFIWWNCKKLKCTSTFMCYFDYCCEMFYIFYQYSFIILFVKPSNIIIFYTTF